ncbi:MAG: DNRLRE domain-containing protein [Planctomycetes bacterium]|nr:DNRLRE domain-containing protein [Planctomycetota bacterium]
MIQRLLGPVAPVVVVCLLVGCGGNKSSRKSSTAGAVTSGAQVTAVAPGDGPDVGTNTVQVSLGGFSAPFAVGQDQVLFGTAPLTSVSVVSAGVLEGVAPAGSGSVDVTVVQGNESATLPAGYTYHAAEIVAVDPPQGPPGTVVELTVAYFASDFTQSLPEVRVGGTLVSATALASDRLECTVPAGAGAVDVVVSAAAPAQQATLSAGFTYAGSAAAELVPGPNNPGQRNAQAPSAGLVLAQARLRAYVPLTISELAVRAEGSLDESVGAGDLVLYLDTNGDGLLQTTDVQLGAGAAFPTNNGRVTFSGLNLLLAAGQDLDLLVVGELVGAAEVGRTMVVRLLGRDVVASAPVAGAVQGVELRVVNADPPRQLTVSGPTAATLVAAPADGVDVPAFSAQLSTTAAPVECHGVTLRAVGSADAVRDVRSVTLLIDTNGDGQRDAGDTVLGTRPIEERDGTVSFPVNGLRLASTLSTIDLLAVASFRGTAATGATFQLQLDDARSVVAHTYSGFGGCQINTPAQPILGPQLGLQAASALGLRALAQAPQLAAPQAEVVGLRLEAQAGASGAATVTALTITSRGSLDDVAGIAGVTLYRDQNDDGVLDAGDPALTSSAQFTVDDGALTLTFSTPRQLAAAARETWLVGVELAAGATSGGSFCLGVDPSAAAASVPVHGDAQSGGLVLVSSDRLAFVQPGAAEGKDAYLRGEGLYLNDNFGHTGSLAVGDRPSGQLGERLSYVEFPLPTLAAGAAPTRAYAAFYLLSTGGMVAPAIDVQAFQVIPSGARTPWCEGTGGIDDSGDGICYDGTLQGMNRPDLTQPDVNPTVLSEQSIAVGSQGRWVLFDVTAAVQGWYAGTPNHGLRLRDKLLSNTEGYLSFASSEWGVASQHPILIVEH